MKSDCCSCAPAGRWSTWCRSTASSDAWAARRRAQGRNVDHFCFRVEPFDADTIRAGLAAAGVEAGAVEARYGAEGEGPSIYLSDPEGNTIELKGPPA